MAFSPFKARLAASSTAIALSLFGLPAHANCDLKSGTPERYELIELPRVAPQAARSEAHSITDAGDILIRSFNHSVNRQVDSIVLKPDGTQTTVENIFGVGLIFADTLHDNGFVTGVHTSLTPTDPRNTTTPIILDGQGNGLTNANYCAAPEGSAAELISMSVSASGEHAAGLFETSDQQRMIARCAETGSTEVFTASNGLGLIGVTDEGQIVGNELNAANFTPWITGKKDKRTNPFQGKANTKITGINANGDLFALHFGELKVDGLVRLDGKVQTIDFFGETGWSAASGTLGACGELVGDAMQTSYEEFSQLSAKEQTRIRTYTDLINDWDSRRDYTQFIWSEKHGARKLKSALSVEPGWSNIVVQASNSSGVMVGGGTDPDGITRAIKLVPIK